MRNNISSLVLHSLALIFAAALASCDESIPFHCATPCDNADPSMCSSISEVDCRIACEDDALWPGDWKAFESQVISEVNAVRATSGGVDCGSEHFAAAAPVAFDPLLAQMARCHSASMSGYDFFSHDDPFQNNNLTKRLAAVGYSGSWGGENIAAGYVTATSVVQGWRDSPGHCRNMMHAQAEDIGIGFVTQPNADGSTDYLWTMNIASPL